jgi:hypothetical protein
MKKPVEYRIRENDKYEQGYFFTPDELVELVNYFQTSDPLDAKHMNIKESLNKYLNE